MNELGNFYTQDDLVGLARYQIIVKISVNASISNPFSATTLPLPETKDNNRQKIIAASEEQYYRKTEALDMTQASIYVPNAPPPTRSYSPATPYRPQQQTPSSTIKRSEPIKPKPAVPSKEPTLEELDKDRSDGLRPSVVGCFLNSGKILFVYQKTHQLWQLPQGGVDNRETTIDAFKREMAEELGGDFLKQTSFKPSFFSADKIEFPPDKQGLRELKLDSGNPVKMKGKKYYFLYVTSSSTNLKFPSDEEYNDFKWVNYVEALELVKTSTQGGKLRITISALDILKNKGLLTAGTNINSQSNNNGSRPNHQPQTRNTPVRRPPKPDVNPIFFSDDPGYNSTSSLEQRPNSTISVLDTKPSLPDTIDESGADLPANIPGDTPKNTSSGQGDSLIV